MIRIPRSGNFYFTLGFLIFLLIVIITATNYGKKASLFPLAIGIPTLLLVLVELARDQSSKLSQVFETDLFRMKRHKAEERHPTAKDPQQFRKEIIAISVVIGFFIFGESHMRGRCHPDSVPIGLRLPPIG